MDALTSTAPAPSPAPAPAPAPAMPLTAAPMPPTTGGGGGFSGQGFKDFMKSINWVEIGFGVLGTAVLYYTIFYYKHNINISQNFKVDLENKIDDLTMKVSDLSSIVNSRESTQRQSSPNDLFV